MTTQNTYQNPYLLLANVGFQRLLLPVAIIATFALLTACSKENDELHAAAKNLSADELKSIEFSGSGRWFQFGQSPNPNSPWPPFDVSSYTATINYGNGNNHEDAAARVQIIRKQVIEPGRLRPAPVEQKPDQYVNGSVAWNLAAPQGAPADAPATPQPQPTALEERVSEIWTTPQGFIKAALANNAEVKTSDAGTTEISFNVAKNHYEGRINAQHQVEQVKTWIDNPVLGDTPIQYTYSDYKDFGGISFPAHIVRTQGDYPVLDLNISTVKQNAAADIPVPAEISSAGPATVTVTSETLAPGVFYLRGGTHHSLAIEQQDHVVVIEAPLNEQRSLAVIEKVKELIPNKPITHLINTHQHFDHSGGLRTYVDDGATIVTHEANKPFYEKAWAAPHKLNPDRLALSQQPGKFETFADKLVYSDTNNPIEIHQIANSGHNDAFALIYLPAQKILIEADAYTPLASNAPRPPSINPYSTNLYENIQRLKLDVHRIAALHGPGIATLGDLQDFIGVPRADK